MSWIVLTLISVVMFSLVNIFDKYSVSKRFKSIYSFAVVVNILYLVSFGAIGILTRETFVYNAGLYWTAAASAVYFLMWIFLWKALTQGEVSRISAIFFSQPLFNAVFAAVFLRESLTGTKWIAILIIVLGAALSSWENKKTKKTFNKSYLLALFSTVAASLGNVFSKQAMVYWPPLTVQVAGYLMALPFFLLFLKNKTVSKEVKGIFLNGKSLALMFARSLLGVLAICFFMLGVGAGPVSLVSALSGTQPVFMLVFSTLITVFRPKYIRENIDRSNLIIKSAAVILIVFGAVIIAL